MAPKLDTFLQQAVDRIPGKYSLPYDSAVVESRRTGFTPKYAHVNVDIAFRAFEILSSDGWSTGHDAKPSKTVQAI